MFPFDDIIMIEFSFHWLNTTRMQTNTAMSQIDKVLCLSIFHRRGLFSWLHIFVLTKLWIIKKCYWVIPWWRHQMETFSALLDLGAGNSPVTDEFPPQRPLTWSFDFFLWSVSEQTAEQKIETPVLWDAIVLIMTPMQWIADVVTYWFAVIRVMARDLEMPDGPISTTKI